MINIKNFHSNLLKIGKKLHEDSDIYYISYIMIKKLNDCESSHSGKSETGAISKV